ncbi:hypothetical protein VKS41_002104 [Umbelopsis sp. WA50703]
MGNPEIYLSENNHPARSSRTVRAITTAVLLTAACGYFFGTGIDLNYPQAPGSIGYQEGNFTWTKCYDNYDCSTLEVPIDYHDPQSAKFNLSIIRMKATKQPSQGPLFVNPGGPGGSGVDLVRHAGDVISKSVGGHYDIIGFDPRGVARSNPIRCFEDGTESKFFLANRGFYLNPGDNPANFAIVLEAYSKQCIRKNPEFLAYVSTAFVARDIDALRDAFGQEVTNYWGFSYGTFLGATYVNMFPDRVGRVLLDGVTDPTTFSGELVEWISTSLIHTEDGLDKFGASCEVAGPEKCALAHPDKALAFDGEHYVAPTIRQFLKHMANHPMLAEGSPDVILQTDAAALIFAAMYVVKDWPPVAEAFAQAIFKSETNGFMKWKKDRQEGRCPLVEEYTLDAMPILCIDGHHKYHQNLTSYLEGVDKASKEVSPLAAPLWGSLFAQCLYWKVEAAERFAGPWNHELKNKIMVIGVTGDPVTPVESAQKLERIMDGNSVFHQHHGWGHCSLGQPSKCTSDIIHNYFTNGVLPEKGSQCPMESVPFESTVEVFDNGLSTNDYARLADALHRF